MFLVELPISTIRSDILQFFKDSPLSQSIRADKNEDKCHYLKWTLNWLVGGDKNTLNVILNEIFYSSFERSFFLNR